MFWDAFEKALDWVAHIYLFNFILYNFIYLAFILKLYLIQ